MSLFSSNHYSQTEYQLTEDHLKLIVSFARINTLKQEEARMAREEILRRRGGDGQISLYQIYEVLTRLKDQNKISKFDRDSIMKKFEEYFSKK
jgi:Fe2+ or Zn2+ uptake regulation protein